jgi:hypothetical protein
MLIPRAYLILNSAAKTGCFYEISTTRKISDNLIHELYQLFTCFWVCPDIYNSGPQGAQWMETLNDMDTP